MPLFRQTALRHNLETRARLLEGIRCFFTGRGYLEVETPARVPAPAPEAHIDAEPSGPWVLHTSPELCMKRLLAAGYDRIFQICKCYRQNERGGRHLPEMTLLEWYTANADYTHMMTQCREMLLYLVRHLNLKLPLVYQGQAIDVESRWETLSVAQAFERYGSLPMTAALECGRFDEIMGLEIEPQLGWARPVLLMDYPAACGSLARTKPGDASLVERFELYIAGLELCNGFSELIDGVEQRRRFEEERTLRKSAGRSVYPMPERFLEALACMPPATGNAMGLDRLAMLITNSSRIDEVVTFIPEEL
jgi:lysyl-tRNA synthetase class 2